MVFLLIFISVLPVILLAIYIYNKDISKESKTLLLGLFSSGILAIIFSTIINILILLLLPDYYLTDNYEDFNFISLFLILFFEVAFVEEISKWVMLRIFGYRSKKFDQMYDIIVYSVFIALGFALVENLLYVLQEGITVGIYRAIFSVPGHACFGVFMGYYLGLARYYYKKNKTLYIINIIYSIFIPVMLHTIFNFCLINTNFYFWILFILFIVILYTLSIKKINEFSHIKDPLE